MIELFTVLAGFIALYALLAGERRIQPIFWIFIICLILADGLRWEMGTDWTSYTEFFRLADHWAPAGFEPGFVWYTKIIRYVTDNYSIYLLLTTAIMYLGVFGTVFGLTERSFLSIFYLTGTLPWYSGSLRQMLACVFFAQALKAAMRQKLVVYMLLMLGGVLFHTTILAFIPMYWLFGISLAGFFIVYGAVGAVAYFSRDLVPLLDLIVSSVLSERSYAAKIGGTFEQSNPLLGFLRKGVTLVGHIVFVSAAATSPAMNEERWKQLRFTLMLVSFSLIVYYVGTYDIANVSSRLDVYLNIIATAVLVGLLDRSLKRWSSRVLLFAFVVFLLYVVYSRLAFFDLFHPYSSVFYNTDLHRELY